MAIRAKGRSKRKWWQRRRTNARNGRVFLCALCAGLGFFLCGLHPQHLEKPQRTPRLSLSTAEEIENRLHLSEHFVPIYSLTVSPTRIVPSVRICARNPPRWSTPGKTFGCESRWSVAQGSHSCRTRDFHSTIQNSFPHSGFAG